LFGASNLDQLESNLKCVEVISKITPEIEKEVEEIWQTKPTQELDYHTWTPMPDKWVWVSDKLYNSLLLPEKQKLF